MLYWKSAEASCLEATRQFLVRELQLQFHCPHTPCSGTDGKWWTDEQMEKVSGGLGAYPHLVQLRCAAQHGLNPPFLCVQIYGWPFGLTPKWRAIVDPYKAAGWAALQRCTIWVRDSCRRCCSCCRRGAAPMQPGSKAGDLEASAASRVPLATLPTFAAGSLQE